MVTNYNYPTTNQLYLLILSLFLLTACGGGGSGSSNTQTPPPTIPEPIVYVVSGQLLDDSNTPIDGALVTVDGIQADELTNEQGNFTVKSDSEFGSSVEVTAAKESYESVHLQSTLLTATEENHFDLSETITMQAHDPWGFLEINITEVGALVNKAVGFNSDSLSNCDCTVNLSGKVYKKGDKNTKVYVLLAIDTSGSTADNTIDGKRVFDIEIEALNTLLDTFDSGETTYVGIIKFASAAETVVDFSNDMSFVKTALAGITPETSGTSGAATNYQAAFELAQDSFAAAKLKKHDLKTVAFLSDGIPTAPFGSGSTQQAGDRTAAIEAANALADTGITVNTFPVNVISKLTTLPAISAITSGIYYEHQQSTIINEIKNDSLVGIKSLEIFNETNELSANNLTITPDGAWSGNMCLTGNKSNKVQVTPLVCDSCENVAYQRINVRCGKQEQECESCAGQLTSLTLSYQGGENDAQVVVVQYQNENKQYTLFDDTVSSQESFEFFGASRDKTMGPEIRVYVNGQLNAQFVTSCGQPKTGPGLVNGDFAVVEGYSRNGGLLCPVK